MLRASLLALAALTPACGGSEPIQLIRGLAVGDGQGVQIRALSQELVVASAPLSGVDPEGDFGEAESSFILGLPAGGPYVLELVDASGASELLLGTRGVPELRICAAGDLVDLGPVLHEACAVPPPCVPDPVVEECRQRAEETCEPWAQVDACRETQRAECEPELQAAQSVCIEIGPGPECDEATGVLSTCLARHNCDALELLATDCFQECDDLEAQLGDCQGETDCVPAWMAPALPEQIGCEGAAG